MHVCMYVCVCTHVCSVAGIRIIYFVFYSQPANIDAQKALGAVLLRIPRPDDAARAKDAAAAEKLLRGVVKARADDLEAWLDLAAVLERSDAPAALEAYAEAARLLAERGGGLRAHRSPQTCHPRCTTTWAACTSNSGSSTKLWCASPADVMYSPLTSCSHRSRRSRHALTAHCALMAGRVHEGP